MTYPRTRHGAAAAAAAVGPVHPLVEPLEHRRLMSTVSLADGALVIRADGNAPMRVNVTYAKGADAVRVRADGQALRAFGRSMVSAVRVVGGAGNDVVVIAGALDLPADVRTGAGKDRVTGGGGDDTIDGGAGDDTLRGRGGRDTILGGDGDDRLDGGRGDGDRIDPGEGRDRLPGVGRGDDRVFAAVATANGDIDPAAVIDAADLLPTAGLAAAPDPADWIQRAIDASAAGAAGEIRLPPGQFRITHTIHVPQASGIKITGSGQIPDVRRSSHYGPATVLIWDGPAGGTMFDAIGTTMLTVSDMTLIGRPATTAANRAGVLLHGGLLPGWGTGLWTVRNVAFIDADCGVQMGDLWYDFNCADSVFDRVAFVGCDTGFRVKNNQGVNYLFNYLAAESCKCVIDMQRGGDLLVNVASFSYCGAPGDDDNGYAINFGPGGDNVGVSTINQLRFEGGLRVRVGPYRRVEFRGLHEAAPINGGATFDVTASTVLLTGATLLRTITPGWVRLRGDGGGSQAAFSVDAAMFEDVADPTVGIDAAPGCYWSIRNSFRSWGTPLPDRESGKWL